MFSRRHPYLFFVLSFVTIISVTSVLLSALLALKDSFPNSPSGEVVAVIELKGVIMDAKETIKNLKEFREDESVKSIVLRIDSPGGSVGPSQEIYREVVKTRRVKPVIASMGSVAASGGYYAAAAADGIMANPGTITGSIGVIMGYTNFKTLFDKIGLVPVVVKGGEFKDMGSPARDMRPDEKKIFQGFADKIHARFIKDVADGRKMSIPEMEKIADGRIYTGEEAQALGLLDRLGNIEDAIDWAGELGGIKGKVETVYPEAENLSIVEYLTASTLTMVEARIKNIIQPGISADYMLQP